MKAVMFWNAEKPLTVEDISEPTPGAGELLIKVGRCGLCGSDLTLTQLSGFYPENSVLGHEFAGEIVALGSDVKDFKVGDVVTAMPMAGCQQCLNCLTAGPALCSHDAPHPYAGGFAEYMNVAARASVKLPSSLSLTDGALVEPLAVGLHGVKLSQAPAGARVLVMGAGSVGLSVIHWARKLGAGRIVAASRSRRREEMARFMGADAFVETGEGEEERIAEALGGPPDVVYECVGAVGAVAHSLQLVKPLGTVVSLGFCTKPDPIYTALSTFKQAKLIFSMAYFLDEFQFVVDMLERGHVEPRHMISTKIGLDDVPAKIDELRVSNTETKVHVDPWLNR